MADKSTSWNPVKRLKGFSSVEHRKSSSSRFQVSAAVVQVCIELVSQQVTSDQMSEDVNVSVERSWSENIDNAEVCVKNLQAGDRLNRNNWNEIVVVKVTCCQLLQSISTDHNQCHRRRRSFRFLSTRVRRYYVLLSGHSFDSRAHTPAPAAPEAESAETTADLWMIMMMTTNALVALISGAVGGTI